MMKVTWILFLFLSIFNSGTRYFITTMTQKMTKTTRVLKQQDENSERDIEDETDENDNSFCWESIE